MRFARSRVSVAVVATGVAALGAALFPVSAHAAGDTWVDYATVSMTDPNTQKLTANRLCYTDGRDLACDGAAGLLLTSGTLSIPNISATALTVNGVAITGSSNGDRITSGTASAIANSSSGYISLTTGATTWGYLGSSATYLPTLNVGGNVSASAISTTVAQIASRTVTSIAGGGGNYIVSGTTSVSTSSAGSITFVTGGTQRMVVASSGNVGIGILNPNYPLQVISRGDGPFNGGIRVNAADYQTNGGYVIMNKNSGTGTYASIQVGDAVSTAPLILNPNGGNVGIGTVNPGYKLEVAGQVAGNAAYVNTSDVRLKTNIRAIPYGLETVGQLRPVTFEWKAQKEDWQKGRKLGLVAQEVERIVPEAVTTASDASGTKSIAYGDLTPILIKAVQELKADNDNLRAELKAANANTADLRRRLETIEGDMHKLKAARH